MDDPVPVDRLERDWRRELGSPALRNRYGGWRETEPALARFRTPLALVGFLHRPGSFDEKDEVLCALLRQARVEPLAGRLVLQALRPGLKALAARLLFDARDRDEVWSLLLGVAWEQICGYAVTRRPQRVASNLLLDTLRGVLRERKKAREAQALLGRDPAGTQVWIDEHPADDADVVRLIGEALAGGAIDRYEAELIVQSRIIGLSLVSMAADHGVSFDVLKHRRSRAERRLQIFLALPVPSGGPKRRSSVARVAGGAIGLAGSNDQATRRRR